LQKISCLEAKWTTTIYNFKMKQQKAFKIIAIISYLLIILMGDMIGLPFFFWLLFTLVDFGNADQLFALLAVIGLTLCFIKLNATRTLKIILLDILCFVLLASPVARRLTAIPIEKFNYLTFIIPTTFFVLFYFVSIYFSVKQYLQIQKA
jgi:hypothetical protein